jgi:NAD+ synthase
MVPFDAQKTTEALVEFLKKTLQDSGFSDILIGLSGGIDSATSCALAVSSLGVQHVHPVLLPYGELSGEGEADAYLVAAALKIPESSIQRINIQSAADQVISLDPGMDEFRKGNIMARMRMIFLYDLSKKLNALVLGTENKTEHLLGYFTRFGDEASDIEPIRGLYKTEIRQLAAYLQIPEKILIKAPTAGLWNGQTDEKEFGFNYEDADQILSLIVDDRLKKDEVISKGFPVDVVEKVIARMHANEFKHHLPHSPGK